VTLQWGRFNRFNLSSISSTNWDEWHDLRMTSGLVMFNIFFQNYWDDRVVDGGTWGPFILGRTIICADWRTPAERLHPQQKPHQLRSYQTINHLRHQQFSTVFLLEEVNPQFFFRINQTYGNTKIKWGLNQKTISKQPNKLRRCYKPSLATSFFWPSTATDFGGPMLVS
jgi:hypothetical protein